MSEQDGSGDEWTEEELGDVAEQIRVQVQATAEQLEDLDVATAVDLLLQRLNAIEGVAFERDWAVQVVEGLRRGDDVHIELG